MDLTAGQPMKRDGLQRKYLVLLDDIEIGDDNTSHAAKTTAQYWVIADPTRRVSIIERTDLVIWESTHGEATTEANKNEEGDQTD